MLHLDLFNLDTLCDELRIFYFERDIVLIWEFKLLENIDGDRKALFIIDLERCEASLCTKKMD